MGKKKSLGSMSREEIAAYVGSHDVSELGVLIEDTLEIAPELEAKIRARRKMRPVTLRLNEWMVEAAKDQAFKLGIPYQTLMRMWISIGIHQTQDRIRPGR